MDIELGRRGSERGRGIWKDQEEGCRIREMEEGLAGYSQFSLGLKLGLDLIVFKWLSASDGKKKGKRANENAEKPLTTWLVG